MPLAPACLPRIVKVNSACGCTLTATSIRGLTPDEFEALAYKEVDLARVIMGAAEAKALGIQERGIDRLLKSSIKNIKGSLNKIKVDEQSIILPYIQRRQGSVINNQYFTVEAGAATVGAGTGGIPASAWDLTVNLGSSWLKTELEAIQRYFLPGMTLQVMTWDNTTNKNARTLVFTILGSVNADSGGVKKAKITCEPNINATTWAGYDGTARAVYQPTFGVAQVGANSIHDRESWCQNMPADLSKKIIVNWIQTSRESRCVEEQYEKTLKLILSGKVNEFQRGMVHMPLAEQNKIATQLSEQAWLRSVFYGQRINDKQTPETYDQLPTVADVNDPGCPLGYKANALGIFTLLQDCNRVMDFNGADLNLPVIWEEIYKLKRYRDGDGDSVSVIDSMTDRLTHGRIFDAMNKYYKAKFGWETHRMAKLDQKITHDGIVMFNYNIYDLPDQSVQWAVFHDTFFDDYLSAFPATVGAGVDFKARGRMLLFIDWSDVNIGIAGTTSVNRKDPDPDTNALYKCVILPSVKSYNLRSQKWTAMVDRPQRHLIAYNFSGNCPLIDYTSCDVPNPPVFV